MKVLTRAEALAYWEHPSQQQYGLTLESLPEPGFIQYFAVENLAAMVHVSIWPSIYIFHIGVKPKGYGKLRDESLELLNGMFDHYNAELLITYVPSPNRAAKAMAVRTGLTFVGVLPLSNMQILLYSWKKENNKCQQ